MFESIKMSVTRVRTLSLVTVDSHGVPVYPAAATPDPRIQSEDFRELNNSRHKD